jgi:hypothetical protein
MEIFPPDVSKGKAIEWLCKYENLDIQRTMGLGNDFNDLDLLRSTAYSYVVENAVKPLQEEFIPTLSNNEDGFAKVVGQHFSAE